MQTDAEEGTLRPHTPEEAVMDVESLRRDPALLAPTRGQVYTAWEAVSRTFWKAPDLPYCAGSYAAAEWSLQLTDRRPVSPYVPGYEPPLTATVEPDGSFKARPRFDVLGDELNLILEVLRGGRSVRRHGDYVHGAYGWLLWWVGATEEPLWLPQQKKASA